MRVVGLSSLLGHKPFEEERRSVVPCDLQSRMGQGVKEGS